MTPRTTDRITEYQNRRAIALNYQEKTHDLLIEAHLKKTHGQHATGYKALLVRRTLTQLAFRTADNQGAILP